ncbi:MULTISPECIES: CPBP family intramembrane glutamic endopeptidase [unclassified Shewanella]|uniref:CPBP family intramembrane glutamic endopeptidase n=1 Tax=Shewanella TaxID=22 RepID=UPI0021DA4AD4|nr:MULTISPECIES: CPBP family intramembrane glutamic endopeptidase [unclassified Shewanella]MCU8075916.1 CPBP family intramembrane metalloprotease [Shewanella sp. SM29]MCU8086757.1 CPBP family intramembrane metalloprotease [Shewanella sp. SM21]
MLDLFLSLLGNVGIIVLIVFFFERLGKVNVNIGWMALSFFLFTAYFITVLKGGNIIPLDKLIPDLNWNWGGKVASILLWIVSLFLLKTFVKGVKLADAGFTWKQNLGSVKPAVIVIILFIGLQLILSYSLGNGPNYDTEKLLYQALMPGFDEEPMFRGILLYCISFAVVSQRFNLFGAKLNIAGLLLVILFGLVHGLMYSGGEWQFSLISILITGFYGFILLWLRERTGSLVFPIIAHNLVNLAGQFV